MPLSCFSYPADVPRRMPVWACFSYPADVPRSMPFSCFTYPAGALLGAGNRGAAKSAPPSLRRMPAGSYFKY